MCNLNLFKQSALFAACLAACLAVVGLAGAARAETAVIAWEQQIGETDYHESGYYSPVTHVVLDSAGNSVYVGRGRTSAGTATWVNKLSGAGGFVWSRDLGFGQGLTQASDVITDKAGNVFVAGSTTEALSGTNQGGADGFVAKLGAGGGEIVWLRQIGTAADDRVTKIARDATGSLFVAMGDSLVKLSPAGSVVWRKPMGASHLRLDTAGNPIVAGTDAAGANSVSKRLPGGGPVWKKSLNAAPKTLAVDSVGRVIVGYGNRIAKYSESGVLQWRRARATYSEISTDENGDLYVMTEPKVLSKFSGADGILYWTRNVDPNNSHSVRYLRSDSSGRSAVIGAAPPDTGYKDFYWAAKYNAEGALIWYQRADNPHASCDELDLADGALHRTGDVFISLNTGDSRGSLYKPWGIRLDEIP